MKNLLMAVTLAALLWLLLSGGGIQLAAWRDSLSFTLEDITEVQP